MTDRGYRAVGFELLWKVESGRLKKLWFAKHGVVVTHSRKVALEMAGRKYAVFVKCEGHGEAAGRIDVAVGRNPLVRVCDPIVHRCTGGSAAPAKDNNSTMQPFGGRGQAVEKFGLLQMELTDIGISFLPGDVLGLFCRRK